jgi:hypothetical protein
LDEREKGASRPHSAQPFPPRLTPNSHLYTPTPTPLAGNYTRLGELRTAMFLTKHKLTTVIKYKFEGAHYITYALAPDRK